MPHDANDLRIDGATNGFATIADDPASADRISDELDDQSWPARDRTIVPIASLEEAIHAAMATPGNGRFHLLVDVSDDPQQGAHADGTAALWALLDLGASHATLAALTDRTAVAAAWSVGIGGGFTGSLGAESGDSAGYPLPVTGTVLALAADDCLTSGRLALLAVEGRHGTVVNVVISECPVTTITAAKLWSLGIDLTDGSTAILTIKAGLAYARSAFATLAATVVPFDAPGPNDPILTTLS